MKNNFAQVSFLLIISMICLTSMPLSAQITRYVKEGGTGTGTSWADASGSLQAMLDAVKANSPDGGSIWVAAGTYTGQFNLDYGNFGTGQVPVTMLGGFPNTGTPGLGDRAPANNLTNLSGRGFTRVMFLRNIGADVTIDGFILKDGNANQYGDPINGSQPIFGGGAVENQASYAPRVSNPHFIDCKFINNTALERGGAVMSTGFNAGGITNIRFTRCEFSGNSADGTAYLDGGGAVGIYSRSIGSGTEAYGLFVDCTFTNNMAYRGGAIMVGGQEGSSVANLELVNVTLSGNKATLAGGGIYAESEFTEVKITNSRITGNQAETGNGGGLNVYCPNNKLLTTVWNTTFSGNKAALAGGAIFNNASGTDTTKVAFKLTNTVSWNNLDNTGTGTASSSYATAGSNVTIINYSLLQGQNPAGTGNLNGTNPANDPDFVTSLDPNTAPSTGGNFRLLTSSPCINVGTNTGFPADIYDVDGDMNTTEPTPDLDTQERIENTTIDLGPYEGGVTVCTPPVVNAPTVTQPTCQTPTGTIVVNATGGTLEYSVNNGSSWQASSTFSGLAAGNYNIKVRLQSDPNCMTAYASNPVVLNAPTGCCPAGTTIYVNDNAGGANNGTSWTDAYTDLQNAIAEANNCPNITQIWVAAGTYKPTTGTDRTISFNMKNNLAIYGGFIGTETLLSERNWFLNITVLSGDIGTPGDNTDNSYHVIRNENINNTAILDGFRIFYGNANGTGEYLWGGGVYNTNASPTIKQCGIIENNAQEGGGMANRINSSPIIDNCGISFNHATVYKGGGIYNETNSSPVIVNTIFRGNTAAEVGGAIYNVGNCNSELMNCTLVANSANTGAGIASFISNPVVTNSIFWNNTGGTALGTSITFSYSLLQDAACPAGHTCGTGMIYNIDPLFVSPTDAHLQPCSPAKNVGTATGAPATDFDGDSRPQGAGIDMGYDENGAFCCPGGNILYVNDDATGANNGTSWTNAFNSLQDALAATANCPGVTQIWVATGTYKPTTGTDRTISFVMKNNLAIYGGFIGTETLLSERNWFLNITVLSGDIGTPGDNTDNSYHVIRNENINNTAILDGFRIFYGNANGTGEYLWGGGVYNTNASPTIKQCGIIENNAQEGGGMANRINSSPIIDNCGISFNHATVYKGGGIYNETNSSPVIVNTIFRGNTAAEVGGAIYNVGNCNSELMNCTLVANSANTGAGIASFISNPVVTNSIFWNNTGGTALGTSITFSYSLLQDAACPAGHTCGTGMIYNIDPLFVSPTDAHLQPCSPAKDAGTANGAPATDFDGDARPQGAGFDMGFDENGTTCSACPNTLAVSGTIATGTYQAAMDLTSNGTVQNGSVVSLKAGNSVTLEANFEVQLGGVLEAVIESCVPFVPPGSGNQ